MRAAVYYGSHDVRIEERPRPRPRAGELVLRVLRSGICGSDTTEWTSGPRIFPTERRHPVTGALGPFVFGHEFVGEVAEVLPGSAFAEGDLVACGAGASCGGCARCIEGRTNLCQHYFTYGLNSDGGLAEYVSVLETTLVRIPAGLDIEHAALAQPLAVGFHGARRSGVAAGDRVVMIGAGAIGTFLLMALRRLVPDAVVTVVDVDDRSLARAARLGADATVIADRGGPALPESLLGADPDVVIEASGAPGRFGVAVSLARPGGRVLQVGLPAALQEVSLHELVLREVSVRTTLAHVCASDLPAALELVASIEFAGELIDSVHPLEDVPEQLERSAGGGVSGKILFAPGA